ncbi:MAG: tetratricopeptide repeat protein [Rivularia sp. (in: cyanobacteria)]
MNRNLILVSSLLLLQIPTSINAAPPSIAQNSTCKIEREEEEYSTKELQTLANKITVKVIGDNNGGSGTLIGKQGNSYLILTNYHVIQGVDSIKLQTADGKTYSAEIVPQNNFKNTDIIFLKFQSDQNYCLPEIAQTTPEIDTPILATGFSISTRKIVFSEGKVKKTSNLKEGYEIGYSSNIQQGMSGGAILSTQGLLIGINGKSSYPILDTGYVYQNGKRPSEAEITEMRKLSWGIPISTVLAQVDRDVLTAYKLPLPKSSVSVPEGEYTGWLGELEQKAKQFTVRIDSSSTANGSGIIIAKEGNTYTVLTSAHVLCEREDATKPCGEYKYKILASDGNPYSVDKNSIKIEEGVDLAVVKFNSLQNYQIATIANYNPNDEDFIFSAGYPRLQNDSPWRFTVGLIFDKETGLLNTSQSDFQNNDSDGLLSGSSLTGGYELVYSSITYGGMSGGPVLDSEGRVIGIHGKAEGEQAKDEKIGDCGVNYKCQVKIGYSLGVPVSTFLALTPRLGVKSQLLKNNQPPQLNAQKKNSIEKAILLTDVSGGNATASQWLERGNQLWRLRRYQEAVKAFDEAIKQKPSFVYLAYYGKGLALVQQRKLQESIAALEQAVKLKPDFVAAWNYQSIGYLNLKQLDKALVAINKAIKLQPENPNFYNVKWFVLKGLKQYVKAELAITEAIKFSHRSGFYTNRGIIYSEQKKWKLALVDFNKAIDINPDYANNYNNRAFVYAKQKKWELALADYNKAIDINSKHTFAYYNRGSVYAKQKKWELALLDLNKAIDINPINVRAYNNRGLIYDYQYKYELALADYNKAIDINPDYAETYNNRGIVYDDLKKYELALADYQKAIEINPKDTDAYYNRGIVYAKQKKYELALADYNKATEINPKDADAYYNRGIVYIKKDDKRKAIQDFEKSAQLFKAQGNTAAYEKTMSLLQKLQQ